MQKESTERIKVKGLRREGMNRTSNKKYIQSSRNDSVKQLGNFNHHAHKNHEDEGLNAIVQIIKQTDEVEEISESA